ncbi:hypothetical protein TTHERM_00609500 (macronuclear) [Tetrahymena thermophila SB210]|uniref:Uncharacterized protein n=1 Tax=Tetrahymena thermophila (strain SB210) TaxID=312017 RepID=Q22YD9_TETTS|nr:hypothetical protein TTHERM_00609500 [Tetrahymena thermophila SB210]EAR90346.2 hypothetical protein TTHERM_00609500 [Tetrahymena thermophila SB210]|eukprot:XP_001010591.2 hypothetical protein TTHERM_00609500 [Tetrahymena thermophila SB210]
MGIIEQYFIQIKKYNQSDIFLKKLHQILLNPIDITKLKEEQNYKILKTVRKQFVCFLILRYFEVYGILEIPSFYELWNICFPQEIQIKKKLSKFDKYVKNKQQIQIDDQLDLNNSFQNSSSFINSSVSLNFTIQTNIQNEQEIHSTFLSQKIKGLDQSNIQLSEDNQTSYEYIFCSQKQPINNQIFEEDSYQQESMSHFLKFHNNNYITYQEEQCLSHQNNYEENYQEVYENIYE